MTVSHEEKDVYARVTDKIIADLEKGELTWRKPWSSDHLAGLVMFPLRWNDIAYSGINTIMLWATAAEQGYASPYWMTYKQAIEMKAHVRKGEKGTLVVYADKFTKEEKKADGTTETQQIPFLKQYVVFNASQIEGLSDDFYKTIKPLPSMNKSERIEAIEKFFIQTKASVRTGTKAAYISGDDRIEMPPFECFEDAVSYYATFAHEMIHWTRHPSRLAREFNQKRWGDEGYAKEELVAELGACFLGATLGFEPVTREEHAAYIQSWLKVLKDDKRLIFQAASYAQKAVEYLMQLQMAGVEKEIKVSMSVQPVLLQYTAT